jgi:hypothetical protein
MRFLEVPYFAKQGQLASPLPEYTACSISCKPFLLPRKLRQQLAFWGNFIFLFDRWIGDKLLDSQANRACQISSRQQEKHYGDPNPTYSQAPPVNVRR